jgi:hypothetical protein
MRARKRTQIAWSYLIIINHPSVLAASTKFASGDRASLTDAEIRCASVNCHMAIQSYWTEPAVWLSASEMLLPHEHADFRSFPKPSGFVNAGSVLVPALMYPPIQYKERGMYTTGPSKTAQHSVTNDRNGPFTLFSNGF